MTSSRYEAELLQHIKALKLLEPVAEFKFHPKRRWRFDFAWPDILLAVEIDGGTWVSGRHNTGAGIQNDCDKYEAAMLLGWDIYRCTGAMVSSGRAAQTIEALIKMKLDIDCPGWVRQKTIKDLSG